MSPASGKKELPPLGQKTETPSIEIRIMKKQYHIAVSEGFKSFVQTNKANYSAPSKTKDDLEMSEREFCDALQCFMESLSDTKRKEFDKECERTLALRETRTRRSASVAEVEKLQKQQSALIAKLREQGMEDADIANILGVESIEAPATEES